MRSYILLLNPNITQFLVIDKNILMISEFVFLTAFRNVRNMHKSNFSVYSHCWWKKKAQETSFQENLNITVYIIIFTFFLNRDS